ncbi:glycosyltransferase family 2 protein [Bacillus sp. 2205SS5-2]|uniref:glycosyltransferase family 2 protein n=1 Tax=Bacillus sp. 2205SS5-2 TaxID=3109031 RepID=UPI0030042FA4
MLFSIVVPMYNSERYIGDCIESVLNQTERDFQLIIVNDGSTDACGNIADRYASMDPRIRVIHQKNEGSFHARINGVDNALGEYILFLDADDKLKEFALEKIKEHTYQYEADIFIFRADYFNSSGVVSASEKVFEDGTIFEGRKKKILYEKFTQDASLNHLWIKAIKKECFNNDIVRHYPSILMGDDVLYTLEPLTNAKRIKYIDEVLYNYRISSTSMTKKFQPNVYQGFKTIDKIRREYLSKWELDTENYMKLLNRRVLKNISGIIMYSPTDITGKEKEFLDTLKEIQTDSYFYEIYKTSYRELSLLRKIPLFLLKKGKINVLFYIKPIVTKLNRFKPSH